MAIYMRPDHRWGVTAADHDNAVAHHLSLDEALRIVAASQGQGLHVYLIPADPVRRHRRSRYGND